MFAIVKALTAAPCRNRLEALGWFLNHRFFDKRSELMLQLVASGRRCTVPVDDIQTLVESLRLFTPGNPWEKWTPAEAPMRVIDLGGNMGLSSLYFSVRFPKARIVTVEMMPENAAAIKRLVALNGLSVEVHNIAVGSTDGLATVQLNTSHSRHRLALLKGHESAEACADMGFTEKTSSVAVSRLDTLIGKLGWPSVDLMKVDIEGSEQLLLDDIEGWAPLVRTVFVEIHHNVDPGKAEATMTAHSFRKIGQDLRDRTELWFSK